MKLSNGIKLIMKEHGIETLCSANLVSILDDYKSFTDSPAIKSILKTLVADGFFNEYLSIKKSDCKAQNELRKLILDIKSKTGYSEDLLFVLINEFQEAMGYDKLSQPTVIHESRDNVSNSTSPKDKLYAGGIDMDASPHEIAMQFVNMGYSVKSMSTEMIELQGTFSGIDNTTIRIKGNIDGETKSMSALLPISTPQRDIMITRLMANQFTSANGLPNVASDFFDSCEIIGNCYFNMVDDSRPPFFSRWVLSRGSAVIIYTPFNMEFTITKDE